MSKIIVLLAAVLPIFSSDVFNESESRLIRDAGLYPFIEDIKKGDKEKNSFDILHWAINKGNETLVRKLISIGADPLDACTHFSKRSLLHAAVNKRDIAITALLLEHRLDINAIDVYGYTPLHNSLRDFQQEVEQYFGAINENLSLMLIKRGADVNAASAKRAITPLHLAVARRSVRVAQALLEKGANVNALTNKEGFTPLCAAFRVRNLGPINEDLVLKLIETGADVSIGDKSGYKPIHYAVEYCSLPVVRVILEKNREEAVAKTLHGEYTPLHMARVRERTDVVALLESYGASEWDQKKTL